MANTSQMVQLAREILKNATVIEDYCTKNQVPLPTFDATGPATFRIPTSQPEAAQAQAELLLKTTELHDLVSGPSGMLMSTPFEDSISLNVIYRFNIAGAVPVNGDIKFEFLSIACGLNLIDLQRVVRHAMTRHIFYEPYEGFVAHTAASKALAENELVRDFVGIQYEEKFKSAAFAADALSKWDEAKNPSETGFSLGHGTKKGLYADLQDHPARARRWANAMSQYASRIPLNPLFNGFDWNSLGKALVVDVGGGHGPVSIGLAKHFPNLNFIVQDLPDVINPKPHVDSDVADRIDFMSHDFLLEQPVKGAAVYFFRAVFHNWPDAQCVQVLRRHAEAMDEKSLLVINESLMHRPGTVPAWQDKRKRDMDIGMLAYFGSRERGEDDWRELLREADARLELRSVTLPAPGANHILVIGLRNQA